MAYFVKHIHCLNAELIPRALIKAKLDFFAYLVPTYGITHWQPAIPALQHCYTGTVYSV